MHTPGMAGGERRVLKAPRGVALQTGGGAYAAQLGPARLSMESSRDLTGLRLGLLTRPPRPEGDGWREMGADGYARQVVPFEKNGARKYVNVAQVTFELPSDHCAEVTHVGLFADDGALLYSGALALRQWSGADANAIRFPMGWLNVRISC